MHDFLITNLIGTLLIFLTSAMVYETLAVLWHYLPRLPLGRLRVAIVMAAIFLCHIVAIWIYGLTYWYLDSHTDLGGFTGPSITEIGHIHDLFGHIYFSSITYTSLGLGDIIPTGGMRFLTAIEVLNGLVLICWTVSYAFLAMQRFWKFKD
jgi:hypothetical protein